VKHGDAIIHTLLHKKIQKIRSIKCKGTILQNKLLYMICKTVYQLAEVHIWLEQGIRVQLCIWCYRTSKEP